MAPTICHSIGQWRRERYENAIRLKPGFAEAYSDRGVALFALGHYEADLDSCDRAIRLKPDCEYLPGIKVHTKRSICDWEGIESLCQQLEAGIHRNERVAHPFAMLDISCSAAVQRKAAEILVRDKFPRGLLRPSRAGPNGTESASGIFQRTLAIIPCAP
jgi:protein O-GlcNAc transferase